MTYDAKAIKKFRKVATLLERGVHRRKDILGVYNVQGDTDSYNVIIFGTNTEVKLVRCECKYAIENNHEKECSHMIAALYQYHDETGQLEE